jgi:hypothetical protein
MKAHIVTYCLHEGARKFAAGKGATKRGRLMPPQDRPWIGQRLHDRMIKNPLALLLFVLMLIALYGSYQRGGELTFVCKHAVDLPSTGILQPPSSKRNEAIKICLDRLSD